MAKHNLARGECLLSLTPKLGARFAWRTIWDHPSNRALVEARGLPCLLLPGDCIEIPEPELRQVTLATGGRHEIQVGGGWVLLRVRLVESGRPIIDEPVSACFEDKVVQARSDAKGNIEIQIPAHLDRVELRLEDRRIRVTFGLGGIGPAHEVVGAQARLINLGFLSEPRGGEEGGRMREALSSFQTDEGLEASGELDAATGDALRRCFGC